MVTSSALQKRAALGHDLQHGRELGWRGADDPQNLGCLRLLLSRLGELTGPLFELHFQLDQ